MRGAAWMALVCLVALAGLSVWALAMPAVRGSTAFLLPTWLFGEVLFWILLFWVAARAESRIRTGGR